MLVSEVLTSMSDQCYYLVITTDILVFGMHMFVTLCLFIPMIVDVRCHVISSDCKGSHGYGLEDLCV